jgi:hypothetical protein
MKNIIYLLLIISTGITAQAKYITKTGIINFEASVPSFEEVKASHNLVTAIINIESGEIAALGLVKGFRFKNALMEEHFNENYAESDKYPKTTYKGIIIDFSINKVKNNEHSFYTTGELSFHGKTITIKNTALSINLIGDELVITGDFLANASDFDIEIPKIVQSKIAKDIEVNFNFKLKKK